MTQNVYETESGKLYLATSAISAMHSTKVTVDPAMISLLTTTPQDPVALKASFVTSQQNSSTLVIGQKTTNRMPAGWSACLAILALGASLMLGSAASAQQAVIMTQPPGQIPVVAPADTSDATLIVRINAPTGSTWQWSTNGTAITTAGTSVIQAAAGSGVRNYMDALQCNNQTTSTEFQILDGSTVIFDGFAPGNMQNLGNIIFPTPLRGTANTSMSIKTLTTVTGMFCSAQGHTGA